VWVPVSARLVQPPETDAALPIDKPGSRVSGWAMLSVVMIAIPMVWESFHRVENPNIHTLRLIVASATITLLAGGAWLKEYFEMRELAAERKRADLALRTSEERLRLAIQAGKMYAVDWDIATDSLVRSGNVEDVTGVSNEYLGATAQQFMSHVHPDDRALVGACVLERDPEHPFGRIQYRLVRPDGSIVWLERTDQAFFNEKRKLVRMLGVLTNITERKQAEDALAAFNGRLIQAQEDERTRIARELHDDISQRVALLAIRLGQLKAAPGGLPTDLLNQVSKTQAETAELSLSIQHLSHELHSSTLKIVGLSAAIRSWCGEFGEKRNVDVSFVSEEVPACLPVEVSLHLYRVMQEALNNAAKYSGATSFDVRLWGADGEVHLSITDSGKGFDVCAVENGRGLGLKSMRERMRLVNGSLAIESKADCGTTIHACIPVDSGDPLSPAPAEQCWLED
jgi:PAS domain S-box-containing protein